jgi:hypothetical protein
MATFGTKMNNWSDVNIVPQNIATIYGHIERNFGLNELKKPRPGDIYIKKKKPLNNIDLPVFKSMPNEITITSPPRLYRSHAYKYQGRFYTEAEEFWQFEFIANGIKDWYSVYLLSFCYDKKQLENMTTKTITKKEVEKPKYKEELNSDIWAELSYWQSLEWQLSEHKVILDPVRAYILHWPSKKVSITITLAYLIDKRFDWGYTVSVGTGGGSSPIINEAAEPGEVIHQHPSEALVHALQLIINKYCSKNKEVVSILEQVKFPLSQWITENLTPKAEPHPKKKPGYRERFRRKQKVKRWVANLEQMDKEDKQAILSEIAFTFFGKPKAEQQQINFTNKVEKQLDIFAP